MLTNEEVKQFQKLYLQHFGKQISQKEALDMGAKLINIMGILDKKYKIKKSMTGYNG